jgi:short-subunit dehydrogenase
VCPGPVETGFAEKAGYARGEAESFMPKFLWKTPDEVAKAAVRGLAHGKAVIIPGGFNRAAAAAFHLTPRGILLPLIARINPGVDDIRHVSQ